MRALRCEDSTQAGGRALILGYAASAAPGIGRPEFTFALRARGCDILPAAANEERPMSFTLIENAPARLNRSELAVPGSQPQFFDKAAKGAADVIFLDLEDAVAPDEKEKARKNVI